MGFSGGSMKHRLCERLVMTTGFLKSEYKDGAVKLLFCGQNMPLP